MLWNLLFGLCILGVAKYGDYITDECLQGSYTCPKICDVDHKHYPREECNGKTEKKENSKKSLQEHNQGEENSEVLIKGHKNAKAEQESRPDTTSVQSIK